MIQGERYQQLGCPGMGALPGHDAWGLGGWWGDLWGDVRDWGRDWWQDVRGGLEDLIQGGGTPTVPTGPPAGTTTPVRVVVPGTPGAAGGGGTLGPAVVQLGVPLAAGALAYVLTRGRSRWLWALGSAGAAFLLLRQGGVAGGEQLAGLGRSPHDLPPGQRRKTGGEGGA